MSNQTEAVLAAQEGIYERPSDYLPEREVYESLCRGEGIKLVRQAGFPGCGCAGSVVLCLWVPL